MGESGALAQVMDVISQAQFVGKSRHQLDAKNRITVPAAWRVQGDDARDRAYYVAWPHPNGYLCVFPPERFAALTAKAQGARLSDTRAQAALREIFSSAHRFSCDAAGRAVFPEALLKHAGIDKDLTLVGMNDFFEVWSSERLAPPGADPETVLAAMETLGL